MLKTGSLIKIFDNSGAQTLRILNFQKKKNLLCSSATLSDLVFGVVQDFDFAKKKLLFKKKDKLVAIVITVKKKYHKKNGIFVRFSENGCLPLKITRFVTTVSAVKAPGFYELKFKKRFKLVYKSIKHKV